MVYIIHDIWYICYISSDDNDANIIQKLVKLLRIRVIQSTEFGMGKSGT